MLFKPNRDPNKYPASWHDAIRKPSAIGSVVAEGLEAREVELARKKFNAFKACLRAHPLHPTAQALKDCDVRTEIRYFDWASMPWQLVVIPRVPSAARLLTNSRKNLGEIG